MPESAAPSLPQFDPKKVYLVRGDSLNKIVSVIKMNRPRVVEGSALQVVSQSDQGTFLNLDISSLLSGIIPGIPPGTIINTLDLDVCVDGSPETHTFLIAD